MTNLQNRDPHGIAVTPIQNSGTPRPSPSGPHLDPRAGGEISPSSLPPLPIADRSHEA
jgi:hypothetical protein